MTNNLQNYFLVSDADKGSAVTLYELGNSETFRNASCVVIPYSNPQKKKPEAQFFPILNQYKTELNFTNANPKKIILKPRTTRDNYLQNVAALKKHIQRGDIYEINYCIEFYADDTVIDPLAVFARLKEISKAPYSSLLKIGHEFIICASPELYLKKQDALVYSKPIKGTIKRGLTLEQDEELKKTLYNSLKERTENVMAVDVVRNDLSRFATKGSVQVNKLYNIETFETVHQMVSTVSCIAKEDTTFETILNATFPMASMTGAPKIRAMQLIDEHEDFERKNYSGAMGIIDEKGNFDLAVIIRSIFYNEQSKQLKIAVGGAITYLSDAEKEYEECLLKAKTMFKALGAEW